MFFRKTRRDLERRGWELAEKERALAQERDDIEERLQTLELLVRDRVAGYKHVADAWAEWELVRNERDARYLQNKKHPARTAAEVVREKGREMAELRRQMKLAEYLTTLYEFHFPWLEEFREVEAELDYIGAEGDEARRILQAGF